MAGNTEPPVPEPTSTGTAQPDTTAAPHTALPLTEPVAGHAAPYTEAGVPTLQGVQEKIEARYGTALGATELAEDTPEARDAAKRYEERQKAAVEKLEEIRASMRQPQGSEET